ncbi:hypothetical protein CEUSTIGMA_g6807.t1 [Chlamydomonas eustigma]|uniref:Xylanase inhibitor N-terminal domain-containing protein n=1 Tax=Chlamydomonas eustigma TaxID=1157962 RepID=A0A250X8G8_9CHLO|nr:hypothetical protein CEUSTIGMA_g6807.t1 [Chlamydomonas eustigma]|eukprot:GAX79365.1 hypothetical protein CEUSTIGMA_g6807.t1 [Chlamydomonas eustigma]
MSSPYRYDIQVGSENIPATFTADTGSGIINFFCSHCVNSPTVYNPFNSTTRVDSSPRKCATVVEGSNSTCQWNYTYVPSLEFVAGNITTDRLTILGSNPPLTLQKAYMGCAYCNNERGVDFPVPCPAFIPAKSSSNGFFGGLDRGASSLISQVVASNKSVADVLGFCTPRFPVPVAGYIILGQARPKGLHVQKTPLLNPKEFNMVAKALAWNASRTSRLVNRYFSVITHVSFDNYSFAIHNIVNSTAHLDTGGGPVVSLPQHFYKAYVKAVTARALSLATHPSTCRQVRYIRLH